MREWPCGGVLCEGLYVFCCSLWLLNAHCFGGLMTTYTLLMLYVLLIVVRRVRALSRLTRRTLLLAPQVPRRRAQRPPNMGVCAVDRRQPEPGLRVCY